MTPPRRRWLQDGTVRAGVAIVRFRRVSVERPVLAMAACLCAAMLFGGLGLAVGWSVPSFFQGERHVQTGAWRPGRVDDAIGWGLLVAAGAWLAFVAWLWAPRFHLRSGHPVEVNWRLLTPPLAGSLVIITIAALACIMIEAPRAWRFDDTEVAVLAVLLLASGLLIACWLPLVVRGARGRRLVDRWGRVQVRCPACRYPMVGLKQATCPECGAEYTIDDLIRRQGYEALRRKTDIGARGHSPSAIRSD